MSLTLRPYQEHAIAQARTQMQHGVRAILMQAPTGSGKTVMIAKMLGLAAARGQRSLFLVHRRELIKQSTATFLEAGVDHGIISPGFMPRPKAQIQLASIQTVARRLSTMAAPSLIIFDEAHHLAAGSWSRVAAQWPAAYRIGLTATPERLDGKGLLPWFDKMVKGPSVRWLIDHGFLAPYTIYAPPGIRVEGVRIRAGDYDKGELAAASDTPTITGDAIAHYLKHAQGLRAIAFCCSIAHSKHVTQAFNDAGITAEHVDGETDPAERDGAMHRFRTGKTLILSNVDLFGEGVDVPAAVAGILLRPTKSLSLFLQQVGRVLRPCEGKTRAIILDHAGNVQHHGLPDAEREWSLEGSKERKAGQNASRLAVRICSTCFAAMYASKVQCPYCGTMVTRSGRQVGTAEGDLVEIQQAVIRKKREEEAEELECDTLQDWQSLALKRGHNPGWARYRYMARQLPRRHGV